MFSYYLIYLLLIPVIILVLIVVGVVAFFNNRNNQNNMDPNQMKPKTSATDVFLNLGAFVSLYVLVGSLLNLLFSVIDVAYPQITNGYNYSSSASISWPVSILVVFFPIFVLLMWFIEKQYVEHPERRDSVIHKSFTYITLFVSGVVIAGDLITVVYYFIDGQELTTAFIMKVAVLLVIASSLFLYFISDLRGKLTPSNRMSWRFVAAGIVFLSIVWGFAVLGSPRTQRLYKYDQQKVSDLQNLNNQVTSYFSTKGILPNSIDELSKNNYYVPSKVDSQNQKPYEYRKTGDFAYSLCAEFNKASDDKGNLGNTYYSPYGETSWTHPAGKYCFNETINPNMYPNVYPSKIQPVN